MCGCVECHLCRGIRRIHRVSEGTVASGLPPAETLWGICSEMPHLKVIFTAAAGNPHSLYNKLSPFKCWP